MTTEQESQEFLQRAVMLRQQSEEAEKHLNFMNEQIKELEQFSGNLELLEKDKEKEVLANLGRGVYMKANRIVGEKLFVEAGAGVIVKKTPEEAKKIIQEQINKFKEARLQIVGQLEEFKTEFGRMVKEIERMKRGEE